MSVGIENGRYNQQPQPRREGQESAVAKRDDHINYLTDTVNNPKPNGIGPRMVAFYAKQYELMSEVEGNKENPELQQELTDHTDRITTTIQQTEGYQRVDARGVQMRVNELAKTFPTDGDILPATATALELRRIFEKPLKEGNPRILFEAKVAGLIPTAKITSPNR